MATPFVQFEKFDTELDKANVGTRWKKWITRFEFCLTAAGITNDARMKANLINCAGEQVFDIFESLTITPRAGVGGGPDETEYAATKRTLSEYFNPADNTEYHVFKFRSTKQQENETMDQFSSRLKHLADSCDFTNKDKEVKSQIIQSCLSKKFRREALQNSTWTLKDLLDRARTLELVDKHAAEIEEKEHLVELNATNKVKQAKYSKPKKQQKLCAFCGKDYHKEGLNTCPARGKKCAKCGKMNHFAAACLSTKQEEKQNGFGKKTTANQVTCETDSDESDIETVHMSSKAGTKHPTVQVELNGRKLMFMVDSCAGCNTLDWASYEKLGKPPLHTSNLRISSYANEQFLEIEGKLKTNIKVGNNIVKTTLYVVKDENAGCLLSRKTSANLKLLSFAPIVKCNAIETITKIGKLKNKQIKLHIDPTVPPVAQPHRRIPIHYRSAVEAQLKQLEEMDVIEKVEGPTPWISPVVCVPRADPKDPIRICGDMRCAKKAIQRERHITPTIDDIINEVSGSKYFTKIDLKNAYHQVELAEESRYITTFSTHVGLRRYKRLFFGINCAHEIFHNLIRELLAGLPGTMNTSDDILIHATTKEELRARTANVDRRLADHNLTTNVKKRLEEQEKIKFFGLILSGTGVELDQSKTNAIRTTEPPNSKSAVRSFLGLANYCSRFIKNYSDLSKPLRDLIKDDTPFNWTQESDESFQQLKAALAQTKTLSFFNPTLQTELIVDASPFGLGAVLCQKNNSGESQIIAYASKALTEVEQRYPQTDREALAIIWGAEHFRLYLVGKEFDVLTDHKPLESIFNKPLIQLSPRLERWMLRKQVFKMNVKYIPGSSNIADYLSRNPERKQQQIFATMAAEEYVNQVAKATEPFRISAEELVKETVKDPELREVKRFLDQASWKNVSKETRAKYEKYQNELTTLDTEIILRGTRICIPKSLQQRVVDLAHEGHQGEVRTKQLLRSKVRFPGINDLVKKTMEACLPCQAAVKQNRREPIQTTKLPEGPWEEISVDFYSLPNGAELLVVIDDYSKFPLVEPVPSTSGQHVCKTLDKIFAMFGTPLVVRSDNGPPFNGKEFSSLAEHLGFKHRKITPHWPEAIGQVERFMQNLS